MDWFFWPRPFTTMCSPPQPSRLKEVRRILSSPPPSPSPSPRSPFSRPPHHIICECVVLCYFDSVSIHPGSGGRIYAVVARRRNAGENVFARPRLRGQVPRRPRHPWPPNCHRRKRHGKSSAVRRNGKLMNSTRFE